MSEQKKIRQPDLSPFSLFYGRGRDCRLSPVLQRDAEPGDEPNMVQRCEWQYHDSQAPPYHLTYDVSNRLVSGYEYGGLRPGNYQYAYAPGNKRVWRGVCCGQDEDGNVDMSTDEVAYWSVTGQKLATYRLSGYGLVEEADDPPRSPRRTATWY